MQIELVLNSNTVKHLQKQLGAEKVQPLPYTNQNGYEKVMFTITNNFDVLNVLHAGIDRGMEIGIAAMAKTIS